MQRDSGRGSAAITADVQQKESFDPRASAGLFVGVSHFDDDRLAKVPFAADDAVDLAHLFAVELGLIEPRRVVLALAGDVRKRETRNRLGELMQAGARRETAQMIPVYRTLGRIGRESGPDGLFVVAIATHGFSDQGGDYVVAADSLLDRIALTGLSVNVLFDEVALAHCRRRLVLLDACRERLTQGTRGHSGSVMTKSFAAAVAGATGQVVLSGATLGGFAYDDKKRGNGVFTSAVLDGLRGQAGGNELGFITVRELGDFVQRRVVDWVRENRREHAPKSLGIGRRLEGAAADLPLAVDPEYNQAMKPYRVRRQEALERLRDNLGGVLSGAVYDEIVALLPTGESEANVEGLLEEVEALDGGLRSQQSLRDYLRERRMRIPTIHGDPDRLEESVVEGAPSRSGFQDADGLETTWHEGSPLWMDKLATLGCLMLLGLFILVLILVP